VWELLVLLLLAVGGGVVLANREGRARRLRAALAALPETPLAEARAGRIRVAGLVRLGADALRGPISGQGCAWYEVSVEEIAGLEAAREVAFERHAAGFFLEDGEAGARVVVGGGEVLGGATTTIHAAASSHPAALEEIVRRTVRARGVADWPRGTLRFTERALVAGLRVSVAGLAHLESAEPGEAGYRGAPTRPAFTGWNIIDAA
jgi:hypothetical protein